MTELHEPNKKTNPAHKENARSGDPEQLRPIGSHTHLIIPLII